MRRSVLRPYKSEVRRQQAVCVATRFGRAYGLMALRGLGLAVELGMQR